MQTAGNGRVSEDMAGIMEWHVFMDSKTTKDGTIDYGSGKGQGEGLDISLHLFCGEWRGDCLQERLR